MTTTEVALRCDIAAVAFFDLGKLREELTAARRSRKPYKKALVESIEAMLAKAIIRAQEASKAAWEGFKDVESRYHAGSYAAYCAVTLARTISEPCANVHANKEMEELAPAAWYAAAAACRVWVP